MRRSRTGERWRTVAPRGGGARRGADGSRSPGVSATSPGFAGAPIHRGGERTVAARRMTRPRHRRSRTRVSRHAFGEVTPHVRPLAAQDAVHHGVADRAVLLLPMMAD